MKCIFPFVIGLLAVPVAMAQDVDFEKEFDSFQKQQQKEFNDFKNKADADFDTFLREAWTKFEAFDAVEAPVRPEPVKQPVFDGKRSCLPGADGVERTYGRPRPAVLVRIAAQIAS